MSFWSNPLGSIQGTLGSKGLGELALLAAVGVATDGFSFAADTAPAVDVAGATGATGVNASSPVSALDNFGGAGPAAVPTGAPIDQAAINAGTSSLGAGAGAGAGASSLLSSPYAKAALGLGAGYLMAQRPKNNMPAAPGANPTGPLSILNSAGGVRYPTSPLPTQNAAGGGLMQLTSNPNPPMAYNMTPTYNNATSTPVPQSVLHYASGGSASTSAPGGGTPFDQLATDQQIQYLLSQNPGLQAQYPQQMPSVISPTNPIQAVSAAGGGMMYASGGLPNLGSYSDGGQLLKGPGDGMSDSIPASIAGKQPARLANDEFVVPADVVSHLGNGSSDAGAKKLYDMMDRVRRARTGKPKQAKAIHPERYMPG